MASYPKAPLATRWQRLGGAILDDLLRFVARAIIYLAASTREVWASGGNVIDLYLRHGRWGYVAGAVVGSLTAVQWFLIVRRGQSIGKIVAGSRIVRTDGAPAGFLRGVVIRNGVFSAPALILPLVGITHHWALPPALASLALFDVLFIFGRERRCLHDLLAGTRVIDQPPH